MIDDFEPMRSSRHVHSGDVHDRLVLGSVMIPQKLEYR